jgi:hypothetical protein
MSPEQARSERVGANSDVYSLAVVLFEALTGMLPYTTQHAAPVKAVLEAVKKETPRRPRALRRDISIPLESVILKALEKNPADRYADAEEFAYDLERALAGASVSAKPYSHTTRLRQLLSGRERVVAAFLFLLAAAGAGYAYLRHELRQERYERLLATAHLRNFSARLMTGREAAAPAASATPGAWHAIRMGRRAMSDEDWTTAVAEFQSAVNFAESAGDQRTASMARLDQARSETMLGNAAKALSLYREIIANRGTSPAVAEFAQLEAVQQAVLEGQQAEALELLNLRAIPAAGSIRDAVQCLVGELAPDTATARALNAPRRLQNEIHLAAAIRHRQEGRADEYRKELQRCVQVSSPPSDWPCPLARALYARDRR